MFDYFFHWYTGGVWSNLLASLVWVPLAFIGGKMLHTSLKKHMLKHHEEVMAHIGKIHTHLGINNPGTEPVIKKGKKRAR